VSTARMKMCYPWQFAKSSPRSINMHAKPKGPGLGAKAPEFFIETPDGRFPLHQLAARHEKLILTTQDSYRYHPN
jgi:hypothetical protein